MKLELLSERVSITSEGDSHVEKAQTFQCTAEGGRGPPSPERQVAVSDLADELGVSSRLKMEDEGSRSYRPQTVQPTVKALGRTEAMRF